MPHTWETRRDQLSMTGGLGGDAILRFISYLPVHDREGPWNRDINAASVLHNT